MALLQGLVVIVAALAALPVHASPCQAIVSSKTGTSLSLASSQSTVSSHEVSFISSSSTLDFYISTDTIQLPLSTWFTTADISSSTSFETATSSDSASISTAASTSDIEILTISSTSDSVTTSDDSTSTSSEDSTIITSKGTISDSNAPTLSESTALDSTVATSESTSFDSTVLSSDSIVTSDATTTSSLSETATASSTACPTEDPENLIVNPGFEEDASTSPYLPPPPWTGSYLSVSCQLPAGPARTCSNFVCGRVGQASPVRLEQSVSGLEPGRQYRFSFWAAIKDAYRARPSNGRWNVYSDGVLVDRFDVWAPYSDDYELYSTIILTSSDEMKIRIEGQFYGSGGSSPLTGWASVDVRIDDVSLVRHDSSPDESLTSSTTTTTDTNAPTSCPTTNFIKNPSFETREVVQGSTFYPWEYRNRMQLGCPSGKGQARSGKNFVCAELDLTGSVGTIGQDTPGLVPRHRYLLSYWARGEPQQLDSSVTGETFLKLIYDGGLTGSGRAGDTLAVETTDGWVQYQHFYRASTSLNPGFGLTVTGRASQAGTSFSEARWLFDDFSLTYSPGPCIEAETKPPGTLCGNSMASFAANGKFYELEAGDYSSNIEECAYDCFKNVNCKSFSLAYQNSTTSRCKLYSGTTVQLSLTYEQGQPTLGFYSRECFNCNFVNAHCSTGREG